jgi:hypothetical protein
MDNGLISEHHLGCLSDSVSWDWDGEVGNSSDLAEHAIARFAPSYLIPTTTSYTGLVTVLSAHLHSSSSTAFRHLPRLSSLSHDLATTQLTAPA